MIDPLNTDRGTELLKIVLPRKLKNFRGILLKENITHNKKRRGAKKGV